MWPPDQNSCTETSWVSEPLWSVDLQADYPIKYVRFTNRNSDGMLECCWVYYFEVLYFQCWKLSCHFEKLVTSIKV